MTIMIIINTTIDTILFLRCLLLLLLKMLLFLLGFCPTSTYKPTTYKFFFNFQACSELLVL